MIRMIVADDEPVIIRGLSKLVDWQALGIEIIGTSENGDEAMELLLKEKPALALLDISMPGMTGIDILKNIRELSLPTKVILISGFQDFSYAKSAVTYGAVDYLLKPVIKEELLSAVEKALGIEDTAPAPKAAPAAVPQDADGSWLPVLAALLPQKEGSRQEEKLMAFAWQSFLEEYMGEEDRGFVFTLPSGRDVLFFRDKEAKDAGELLQTLSARASSLVRGRPAFIVGSPVQALSEVRAAAERCERRCGELFFASDEEGPLVLPPESAEGTEGPAMEELVRRRERMIEHLLSLKADAFDQDYSQFCASLARASSGRRDDASYYFCSTVRLVQERLLERGIECGETDMKKLLETARECRSFGEMESRFREVLLRYPGFIRETAGDAGKKDILAIREYIEQHYRDSLTLEVMAGRFFMNPYYFSSWFKKQTGKGFKEYVSYVRLQHALSLLLTTPMKAYEIAAEVGFSDARSFTDAFSRQYGETPASYRKRILQEE